MFKAQEDIPHGLSGNFVDIYEHKLRDSPEGRIPPQNILHSEQVKYGTKVTYFHEARKA